MFFILIRHAEHFASGDRQRGGEENISRADESTRKSRKKVTV